MEKTKVYKMDDGSLAINIPSVLLPEVEEAEVVEEKLVKPAVPIETIDWVNAVVRIYSDGIRLLLTPSGITPFEALSNLGFDPYRPIQVRPYGHGKWLDAHLYHNYYGRVWIPDRIVQSRKMQEYDVYPVLIRGYSQPEYKREITRRRVARVFINHMDNEYPAQEYFLNRWRWVIPKNITCYDVLLKAFELGFSPICECYEAKKGRINVDFIFDEIDADIIAKTIGRAYRNMSVRNYTATVEIDYPFLAECRATYTSVCPKKYYSYLELELMKSLSITVLNLVKYFFQPAKPGLPYSGLSYAQMKKKVKFVQTELYLPDEYPQVTECPETLVDGLEENTQISYHEIPDYPYGRAKNFYRCIKYVRVVNEHSYKYMQEQNSEYEYFDDYINRLCSKLYSIKVDSKGFVWEV
jgi:hypothetical protein